MRSQNAQKRPKLRRVATAVTKLALLSNVASSSVDVFSSAGGSGAGGTGSGAGGSGVGVTSYYFCSSFY